MTSFVIRRPVLTAALGLLLIAAGVLAVLVYFGRHPPDRVRVFVEHLPPEVRFLSLASSKDDKVVSMDWSPHDELGFPFEMSPASCSWSYVEGKSRINWNAY